MLSFVCFLVLITSSLASVIPRAGISLPPPSSSPVCVDLTNDLWEGLRRTLDPYDCAYALLGLKLYVNQKDQGETHNFYSRKDFPDIEPPQSWDLPYGTRSGTSSH